MFQIKNTLVSESIIENDFVCNLSKCKGACCIEGNAGAPLEDKEIDEIKKSYPIVKQYLSSKSINEITKQGQFITTVSGDFETPLVDGKECVYLILNENKVAQCSFEKAFEEGLISWKKPISCHLYPIRTKDFSEFVSVNYDKWSICSDACVLGKELQVPVYKFVKDALIRKFGKDWYQELELAAKDLKK
ncbi:DUF3109 family protein [Flavobacteriaceae bacterium]|jgi:hypothetical protein|nr:DUF3109 family protein [Flavobacteriaceae bacterium]